MIPGITRSKHVFKIWDALKAAGVEGISIQIKRHGTLTLTKVLVVEFICLMRGNKVDQLVGPWVDSLKALPQIRADVERAAAKEAAS